MNDIIKNILNKNTIITSPPGGGSTNLALYLTNTLCVKYNVLYFDTGKTVDKVYIKDHYNDMYKESFIFQGSITHFINYLTDLNRQLIHLDYIVIDTGDILNKNTHLSLTQIQTSNEIKTPYPYFGFAQHKIHLHIPRVVTSQSLQDASVSSQSQLDQ